MDIKPSWSVRSTFVTAWSFKSTVRAFQCTLHQWSWHPKKKCLSVDLCSVLYIERAMRVPPLYNTLSQRRDKQPLLQVFNPDQGVSDSNSSTLLLLLVRRHDRWQCVWFGKQLQLPSTGCKQWGEWQPERRKQASKQTEQGYLHIRAVRTFIHTGCLHAPCLIFSSFPHLQEEAVLKLCIMQWECMPLLKWTLNQAKIQHCLSKYLLAQDKSD